MNNIINIGIFSDSIGDSNSGAGINAYRFAGKLNRNIYYSVSLLSFNHNSLKYMTYYKNNMIIVKIPYFGRYKIIKYLMMPIIIYNICRFFKNKNVVLFFGIPIGYSFVFLYLKFNNIKIIFRSTGLNQDDLLTLITKPFKICNTFNKYIINLIDYYFAINPEFLNRAKYYLSENKIILGSPGVDEKIYSPVGKTEKKLLRKQYGLPVNKYIIISIGYLLKRKGYEDNFKALEMINNSIDYIYIVIGGYPIIKSNKYQKNWSKKRRNEMKKLYVLGNKMLGNNVIFIDSTSNIPEYLKISDVMLHTSYLEGMSNVMIEAMSCGIPVICRDLPGITNYLTIDGYNSKIINSVEDIKNTIEKLYHDKKYLSYLSNNSRNHIINNFTIIEEIKKVEAIMNKICVINK